MQCNVKSTIPNEERRQGDHLPYLGFEPIINQLNLRRYIPAVTFQAAVH